MVDTPLEPEQDPHEAKILPDPDGHAHAQPSWWLSALLASVTGLCLSLAIAALITLGSALNIRPIIALERVGVEEGMRLYMAFDRFLPTTKPQGPSFVFFDVDKAACERSRPGDAAACGSRNPVNAEISVEALGWAKHSGAIGVILDTAPFSEKADREAVVAATAGPGPWVIAPLSGRSDWVDGQTVFNRDPAFDLAPSMAQDRLRLANFDVFWGDEAQDGKIRRYGAQTTLSSPEDPHSAQVVPTAAALAAALSRPDTAAEAECRYYHRCQGKALDHDKGHGGSHSGAHSSGEVPRIVFSVPSLSLQQNQDTQDYLSERYEPIYTRLVASQLPRDQNEALVAQPETVKGRIVVIGSSIPVARDQVITPIGPMAGSELIINATRSIALSQADGGHHAHRDAAYFLREFWTKAVAAVRGAIIMTFAWLAIFAVWRWAKSKGSALRLGGALTVITVFAVGLSLVAFVELYFLATHVGEGQFRGHFVDVLTPLIALGLEGYTEGASVTIAALEHRLAQLVGRWKFARPPLAGADQP